MFDFNQKIDAAELDLKDTVVSINRVTKVVKGGKNLSFSALVVVGDGHGHVGFGIGKAKEVPVGHQEGHRVGQEGAGARAAGRHDAAARHRSAASAPAACCSSRPRTAPASSPAAPSAPSSRRPASRTSSPSASGSDNPHNVVRATFAGLRALKEPSLVARLRGKELEELVGAGDRA